MKKEHLEEMLKKISSKRQQKAKPRNDSDEDLAVAIKEFKEAKGSGVKEFRALMDIAKGVEE